MSDLRPWVRQPSETSKAYKAFSVYLGLGPTRSIAKALDAAGRSRGNRGHWERWSARFDWVARAEAYDAEQLLAEMSRRVEVREGIRQQIYDAGGDLITMLLALAAGRIGEGDVTEIFDKHQNVIGERPVVDARTRAQVGQHLLAVMGIIAPRRVELDGQDGDELRIKARAAASDLSPAARAAIAEAMGIEL